MFRVRNFVFILVLILIASAAGCDVQSVDSPNVSASPEPVVAAPVIIPEPTAPPATPAPTPEPMPTIPLVDPGEDASAEADPAAAMGELPSAGYSNGEGVNVRAEPDTGAEIVDILGENTAVEVLAQEGEWYQVDVNGQTAYVSAPLISLGEAPRGDNTRFAKLIEDDVQTYGAPTEDDVRETKLERDSVVKVLRTIGEYVHVVYNQNLQCYIKEASVEYISEEEYESAS